MFFLIVLLSIYGGLRASSFLVLWVFLEINIINFIGSILIFNIKMELIFKYFIIQRRGSSLFLLRVILSNYNRNNLSMVIIVISILIKLGAAPFHIWTIELVSELPFFVTLLLVSIQKILPIVGLTVIWDNYYFFSFLGIFVAIILIIGQINIKLIIALSSVFNLSLLLVCLKSFFFWRIILLIYSISLVCFVYPLIKIEYLFRRIVFNFHSSNFLIKILIATGGLRIRGFPPLPGFFIKVLLMREALSQGYIIFVVVFLICSILFLFAYINFFMVRFKYMSEVFKFNQFEANYYLIFFLIFISITMILL